MFGEGSGVDAVYSRDFFFFEPVGEAPVRLPVARFPSVVLGYDRLAVYMLAFVVFAYIVFFAAWRDSVIAKNRIGCY